MKWTLRNKLASFGLQEEIDFIYLQIPEKIQISTKPLLVSASGALPVPCVPCILLLFQVLVERQHYWALQRRADAVCQSSWLSESVGEPS